MFSAIPKGQYGAKSEEREVRTLLQGNREERQCGESKGLKTCRRRNSRKGGQHPGRGAWKGDRSQARKHERDWEAFRRICSPRNLYGGSSK